MRLADPARTTASDLLGPRGTFVHYARVGESHFVVLVERPYPWPVGLLLERPLGTGMVLGGAFVAVVFLSRHWRRRVPTTEN